MIPGDIENLINLKKLNLILIPIKQMMFLYLLLRILQSNYHPRIIRRPLLRIQMMEGSEELEMAIMGMAVVEEIAVEMAMEIVVEEVGEMAVEMETITIQKISHITTRISTVYIHYILCLKTEKES